MATYRVIREITNYFDDSDIDRAEPDENLGMLGQRRGLIRSYYAGVDWTNQSDVKKVINTFESILQDAEAAHSSSDEYVRLLRTLSQDGYEYKGGHLTKSGNDLVQSNRDVFMQSGVINPSQIFLAFSRIDQAIDTDPDAAIGSSKELVETICKHILDTGGITYAKADDMIVLTKKVLKHLKLVPDDIPNNAKGADTIKRLLMNLATITQATAELRNLYGTGHGKDKAYKGLTPRHARLCVNAAVALTVFLVQTSEQ